LAGILIVYATSVYRSKRVIEGTPNSQLVEVDFGEVSSGIARVEGGLETIAKYLVDQTKQEAIAVRTCPFLPPRGVGAPPPNHHNPDPPLELVEEETYFPVPGMPATLPGMPTQPGFFLPLPVVEREEVPELENVDELQDLEAVEPKPLHSEAVEEALSIVARKAGRNLP